MQPPNKNGYPIFKMHLAKYRTPILYNLYATLTTINFLRAVHVLKGLIEKVKNIIAIAELQG